MKEKKIDEKRWNLISISEITLFERKKKKKPFPHGRIARR